MSATLTRSGHLGLSISTVTRNHSGVIGRRLSTWRRLMLLFGPSAAKKVGFALAEFAWPDKGDPDAELVARNCTQKMLCSLCDYTVLRGLRKQLSALQEDGWIVRDKDQTGPGGYREYVLRIPDWVPNDAIAEMTNPGKGMWKRALEANTERTGELKFTRYQDVNTNSRGSPVPQKSISGEPQFRNRGTSVPEQVNVSSPLKELVSSSIGDKGKGGLPLRGPPEEKTKNASNRSGQPPFAEMLEACLAANLRGSQWVDISLRIESDFGFTPSGKQITELDRQIRDRRKE